MLSFFLMAANVLSIVDSMLLDSALCRKQYVVHAVDLSQHVLLASWLVCAVNRLPAITKMFSLKVHPMFGASKKISLANPYSTDATFFLSTNQPDLVRLKQSEIFVPAGETRYIGLKFLPSAHLNQTRTLVRDQTRLLVFVNNEDDKNEECMEIVLFYDDVF